MTDTTAASIVTGPVGFLHCAGGTTFELFQKAVYLIFDAGRRAGHLFTRHSSADVNVLEMETKVDLMGVQFPGDHDGFDLLPLHDACLFVVEERPELKRRIAYRSVFAAGVANCRKIRAHGLLDAASLRLFIAHFLCI